MHRIRHDLPANLAHGAGGGKCGARYQWNRLRAPRTSTPDELAQFIPAEIKKWAQVVKDAGITPE
jgi:hypothetical protein